MVLLLILISIGLGVAGQLLLKIGAAAPVYVPVDLMSNLFRPQSMIGLLMYGVSALLWITVLSRVPLSYAYPMLGLGYGLVVLISSWVLGEPVSAHRWIGVFFIIVGFLVTATS